MGWGRIKLFRISITRDFWPCLTWKWIQTGTRTTQTYLEGFKKHGYCLQLHLECMANMAHIYIQIFFDAGWGSTTMYLDLVRCFFREPELLQQGPSTLEQELPSVSQACWRFTGWGKGFLVDKNPFQTTSLTIVKPIVLTNIDHPKIHLITQPLLVIN